MLDGIQEYSSTDDIPEGSDGYVEYDTLELYSRDESGVLFKEEHDGLKKVSGQEEDGRKKRKRKRKYTSAKECALQETQSIYRPGKLPAHEFNMLTPEQVTTRKRVLLRRRQRENREKSRALGQPSKSRKENQPQNNPSNMLNRSIMHKMSIKFLTGQ
jgi:hypothetical protein